MRQKSVGCLGPGVDGVHEGDGDPVDVLLVDQLRHHEVATALPGGDIREGAGGGQGLAVHELLPSLLLQDVGYEGSRG